MLSLTKKHKDLKLDFNDNNSNKIFVWSGNNLLSNVFVLPFYAKKNKLDIILYQNLKIN